jgi:hypothetical protein
MSFRGPYNIGLFQWIERIHFPTDGEQPRRILFIESQWEGLLTWQYKGLGENFETFNAQDTYLGQTNGLNELYRVSSITPTITNPVQKIGHAVPSGYASSRLGGSLGPAIPASATPVALQGSWDSTYLGSQGKYDPHGEFGVYPTKKHHTIVELSRLRAHQYTQGDDPTQRDDFTVTIECLANTYFSLYGVDPWNPGDTGYTILNPIPPDKIRQEGSGEVTGTFTYKMWYIVFKTEDDPLPMTRINQLTGASQHLVSITDPASIELVQEATVTGETIFASGGACYPSCPVPYRFHNGDYPSLATTLSYTLLKPMD